MRLTFILVVAFCFSGCTISVNFYLLNQTDETVQIKAHFRNKKLEIFNLQYDNELRKLKYNLYKSLPLNLDPTSQQGNYVTYDLPPNSTMFIGNGSNFYNFTFDEIIIHPSDNSPIILNWENQNLLSKGTSFLNRHYAYFTITKSKD